MKMPEILAPAGNLSVLKAAVSAGADAVYFGGEMFNARKNANNFTLEDIKEAVRICRLRNVKTNFTLNTLLKESEWPLLRAYLSEVLPLGLDAIILQDIGVVREVVRFYKEHPNIKPAALHASTQMAVEDLEGAKYLKSLGFSRVVLARELTLPEIRTIAKESGVEVEVFVHGALCYCDSGRCLLSAFHGGRSGNRGACAQPCRLNYTVSCPEEGKEAKSGFFMNLKDRWTVQHLPELLEAGVSSLKIEGRMKGEAYSAGVVRFYRELFTQYEKTHKVRPSRMETDTVTQLFNRGGFTEGYFASKKNMVEEHSPKNQGLLVGKVAEIKGNLLTITSDYEFHAGDELEIAPKAVKEKNTLKDPSGERTALRVSASMVNPSNPHKLKFKTSGHHTIGDLVFRVVDPVLQEEIRKTYLEPAKVPVSMKFSMHTKEPMRLTVALGKVYQTALGEIPEPAMTKGLTTEQVEKQLRKTGGSDFMVQEMEIDLEDGLFVPLSSLNELRRKALEALSETIVHPKTGYQPISTSMLEVSTVNMKQGDSEGATPWVTQEFHGALIQVVYSLRQLEAIKEKTNLILMPAVESFLEEEIPSFMKKAEGALVVPRLPKVGRIIHEAWIRKQIEQWSAEGAYAFEACRFGQIGLLRSMGMKVFASADFGVMNKEAAAFFEAQQIPYTLSREITAEEIKDLGPLHNGFVTTHAQVPYMISEQCIYKEAYGCHKQIEGHYSIVEDRKGEKMPLISHCSLCYSELFSEKPYVVEGNFNNTRVEFPVKG